MPQAISSDSDRSAQARSPRSFSFQQRSYAALQLLRPANSVTAMADVLAGIAVAFFVSNAVAFPFPAALLLVLSGAILYAGGVALNDACDAGVDRIERPERPIPSGRISRSAAFALAFGFLVLGLALAFSYGFVAGAVASVTVLFIACYDFFAKRNAVLGPLTMGLCRSGSLLLGVAASSQALAEWWFIGAVPLAYVAAITLVGRGESDGKNPFGKMAVALVLAVIFFMGGIAWYFSRIFAFPYLALFAACVLPAFWRALQRPGPDVIRGAVKAGVLSLIMLDAAMAAVFSHWLYALAILALFPVSRMLARLFPVA
jgi:1,4-dihydroxy-2-naphthoate octaprenyltransferase